MSQNDSNLPEYMPRRPEAPKNIVDLLGGAKKWDIVFSDILGQEFVCLDVSATRVMSKDFAVCTVEIDGERKVMLLKSVVLAKQLLALSDSLPLTCKIAKSGKRYRFTV